MQALHPLSVGVPMGRVGAVVQRSVRRERCGAVHKAANTRQLASAEKNVSWWLRMVNSLLRAQTGVEVCQG